MSKKISQLNELSTALNSDVLPIVNSNETKKITKQNLLKELNTLINSLTETVATKVTEEYVSQAIASVIDSSPATLDTLNELSNALGDDPNFATTVATALGNKHDKSGGTIVNYTIDDYTNTVHADAIHLRVKATEELLKGDVLMFVGFNSGEQAIEVAKRDSYSVPAIGILHENLSTGDFGMAVSNGLFKGIDTSSFNEGTILYADNAGGLTSNVTISNENYNQPLAYVVRSHATNGEIMINIGKGHEQAELVSVSDNTPRGYTPTDESIEGHLQGIRDALENTSGGTVSNPLLNIPTNNPSTSFRGIVKKSNGYINLSNEEMLNIIKSNQ